MLANTSPFVLRFLSTHGAKTVAARTNRRGMFAHRNNDVGILRCIIDLILAAARQALYHWQHSFAGRPVNRAPGIRRRGGPMELRTRLNVLAAIISFAFLTAVVFGMF